MNQRLHGKQLQLDTWSKFWRANLTEAVLYDACLRDATLNDATLPTFSKGATVLALDYNDDIRIVRTGGIHFYLSYQEAVQSS